MWAKVSNKIVVFNPSKEFKKWCTDNLVISNPEYVKKQRMHLWTGNTPKELYLYEKHSDYLVLPFGCLDDVKKFTSDLEFDFPSPDIVWYGVDKVPLYDYQRKAVAKMIEKGGGILQSPTGSGKTQMGIAIALITGKRTLWITHTKDLLNQSKQRAEQYVDKSLIGTITEGKVTVGTGITFATVQTLSSLDLMQYRTVWDCIICDECHRAAGTPTAVTQFYKVLNSLAARHKYGLSATVHRSDGLIRATYALLGSITYDVPQTEVSDKIMKVKIYPRYTDIGINRKMLDTDGTVVYAKLINCLAESDNRNEQIVSDLVKNKEHFNLILSDRLSHLTALMEALPRDCKDKAVMVNGKMVTKKAKQLREQAIEDMRNGTKRYLFATYALAKEGLDIPRLDRLFLTTPQKDYTVIAQSIGRISRSFNGKETPVAYDYVDGKILTLNKAYKKRCSTYKKIGCTFAEVT